jgi:hypothetical protein
MKKNEDGLFLSATDLVGHLNCTHLTKLDLAVADDARTAPTFYDPFRHLLQERGSRHEQAYIDHLRVCPRTSRLNA